MNEQIPEAEIKSEQTIEELKYLIDHFRNLCNSKEDVIRHYRDLVNKSIPGLEAYNKLFQEVCRHQRNVYELQEKIEKMTKKRKEKT